MCYWFTAFYVCQLLTVHNNPTQLSYFFFNCWAQPRNPRKIRKPHIESWEICLNSDESRELRGSKLKKKMDNGNNSGGGGGSGEKQSHRLPLSDVVSDCLRRWFQDTLKEAKAGDLSMQVLVAQMYFNGYGIPKDTQKVWFWPFKVRILTSISWLFSIHSMHVYWESRNMMNWDFFGPICNF